LKMVKQLIAAALVVAIFFVFIQSPTKEQANADDPKQMLSQLLERLADNDEAMLTLISQHGNEMAAIEECHREESEEIKGKLVALQQKIEESPVKSTGECDCDCAAQLADHEKRIAALEAKMNATASASAPKANYMYPTVQSLGSNGGSTGGSTGTMVSGGSTGTTARAVNASYGSTGSAIVANASTSVVYQQQQPRTPLRTAAAVVTAPLARAGHWTYPGEISNHLAGDYGVSTAGMTREQMLNLHDSLHEGSASAVRVQTPYVNVQTFAPARPPLIPRSAPMASDCPGGNCPTAPQVQTRWYLGKNIGRR
jgi:hypothetical protein